MLSFANMIDLAIRPGSESLRPVIEKEILHYDILFALDREGFLNGLTFQGGTSLRLCHGSSRFSEDLDFVGGFDFTAATLSDIRQCVMDQIGSRYGLEVHVKTPKQMREERTYWGLQTDRWQIAVTTNPGRSDLPKQKIKLEVANVPAHTRSLRGLERNYDFLPSSYQDLLIPTETLDEILADKIVSLSCCKHYIRHRDIWDLQWLKQKNAKLDPDLVQRKVEDYQSADFENSLSEMCNRVVDIATSPEFHAEMVRFIDPDARTRTLDRPEFAQFLGQNVSGILSDANRSIYHPDTQPEFLM